MNTNKSSIRHDIFVSIIAAAFLAYLGWLGTMVHKNSVNGGKTIQTVTDNRTLLLSLPQMRNHIRNLEVQQARNTRDIESLNLRVDKMDRK